MVGATCAAVEEGSTTVTATGIITAIIIGAIIGALGRLFVRGKQNISILVTILIGIVAALLGTWIASLFDVSDTGGIDWIELLFQIVLAAIGVSIVAGMGGRRKNVT
ncbi:GlsB/YeaQ/YmgE family stress response membrane protein [Isoptericola sp. NPDC060257]|uniref:GlsB/YeaQ/YmgE family stress response membrane protein n=1 Tax=Isoptericola sp. NPDC060257 TaxID=3347087 RepID=UPI00364A298B